MEKIDRRSCSTLAKTLGTIVSISGAFIVTLYKGTPQLMTASVDLLSHNKLFLPQSNWVIGGMLLGFYCVVAVAFLIVQALVLKKYLVELIIVFYYCFFVAIQSVVVLWFVERDSSAWALNPNLRLFTVLYSGVFGSAFQVGLFSLVPLRKVMVMDYKLTYPSGTATTMLINSFHTKSGAELAGKQVQCLGKYLSMSLIWSCFKWFFSGIGDSCGFDNFPSLGLTLFKNTFYFDSSPTYVGCGLICPHIVNCSVLLGAIISWGFLWPLISQHAGHWYPADLGSNDFKGLYGYKVFIAIALILGDGPYNLIKIIAITIKEICNKSSKQSNLPLVKEKLDGGSSEVTLEQKRGMRYFSRIEYQTGLPVLDMWPWFDKLPKGVPKQPGEVECGYYVMRYMKEIIEDETLSFPTKWAVKTRKSYSQA